MEPLIRFQCWGRSPGDEGGERERDLMMGLEKCVGRELGTTSRTRTTSTSSNFCVDANVG